jgi:hypothetical protein
LSSSKLMGNWLRVLDTAERSQVDHRVPQQLHAIAVLLEAFKAEQQALKLIFPGKGPFDPHPQCMDGGGEEAFAAALGALAVAGILWDVGNQAGIEPEERYDATEVLSSTNRRLDSQCERAFFNFEKLG